jgi:hypothetical protein
MYAGMHTMLLITLCLCRGPGISVLASVFLPDLPSFLAFGLMRNLLPTGQRHNTNSWFNFVPRPRRLVNCSNIMLMHEYWINVNNVVAASKYMVVLDCERMHLCMHKLWCLGICGLVITKARLMNIYHLQHGFSNRSIWGCIKFQHYALQVWSQNKIPAYCKKNINTFPPMQKHE